MPYWKENSSATSPGMTSRNLGQLCISEPHTNVHLWRMDLITQGAEGCPTLAMQSPSQWWENIVSLHDMGSSPDERPLSRQNCTPTQYSPFLEQTFIPKLAFQASGCITQSRYFATPPNPKQHHGYDDIRSCWLYQATDKLLKTHEMSGHVSKWVLSSFNSLLSQKQQKWIQALMGTGGTDYSCKCYCLRVVLRP